MLQEWTCNQCRGLLSSSPGVTEHRPALGPPSPDQGPLPTLPVLMSSCRLSDWWELRRYKLSLMARSPFRVTDDNDFAPSSISKMEHVHGLVNSSEYLTRL